MDITTPSPSPLIGPSPSSFIMFIFTLVETGSKESLPIVTIPADQGGVTARSAHYRLILAIFEPWIPAPAISPFWSKTNA